jgi:hypothetical protein
MIRWEVTSKGRTPLAMLVTYEKHEGLPRDVCFSCTFENKEVALRRVGTEFHFKTASLTLSEKTNIKSFIARWAKDHEHPSGDFKKLDVPLDSDQSLLFPLSLVAQDLHKRSLGGHTPTLSPRVFPAITWVAPIRTKPRRTYDELRRGFSSEGTHTPYLIRKILDTKTQAERFRKIIHRVGKDSGLFERVDIERFGTDVTAPFQVRIVLDKKSFNLTNVGYGVSQALPVLVEVLWRAPGTWFAIQQPEVHLHPRAQAALGDLIFTMAATEGKRFLIETHSDFMLDRYRTNVRSMKLKKLRSQVLFFERQQGRNTVTALSIGEQGELPLKQPRGYRNFFIKEQMDILGL